MPSCRWPLTSSVWWTDHKHKGSHCLHLSFFQTLPMFYLFILHSLISAGPTFINLFFNHNSLSFLGTMMTDELWALKNIPHQSESFSLFCGTILAQRCVIRFQILLCFLVKLVAHNWVLSNLSDRRKRKRQYRMIFRSRLAISFDVGI